MHETISETLNKSFYKNPDIEKLIPELEQQLRDRKTTSYLVHGKKHNTVQEYYSGLKVDGIRTSNRTYNGLLIR